MPAAPLPCAGAESDETDILLLTINGSYIHPSTGLRSIYANMGDLQPRTRLVESSRRAGAGRLVDEAARSAPKVIGVSVSIWNHLDSLPLLADLREVCPEAWIVLGGPEVSHLSADHEIFTHTNVVIRGEGEAAFPEFCASALDRPAGATFQEISASALDLATIDLPYGTYTDEDLSRRIIYVETSRGCPFGCEFCLSSLDSRVRLFDLEQVLAGVEGLYDRGARSFKVVDRTFNLGIERAARTLEFFRELLARDGGSVQFEVVPDRLPVELRQIIDQFGPGQLRLEVGVQTFDPAVAERINRKQDFASTVANLEYLAGSPAELHADLIAGLPGEDLESFGRGFDQLWALGPEELQLGILKKLPGTTLSRHDKNWGMVYNPEPPYQVRSTAALPEDAVELVTRAARFWELVVNRGRYADLVGGLFPRRLGAFTRLLDLSAAAWHRFGRAWGIPAAELRGFLESYLGAADESHPR